MVFFVKSIFINCQSYFFGLCEVSKETDTSFVDDFCSSWPLLTKRNVAKMIKNVDPFILHPWHKKKTSKCSVTFYFIMLLDTLSSVLRHICFGFSHQFRDEYFEFEDLLNMFFLRHYISTDGLKIWLAMFNLCYST